MTKKPTATQLHLLRVAYDNEGQVPAGSFAHYGVVRPVEGTDLIQAALLVAASTPKDTLAAQRLCAALDYDQMLMAGGFLGVERHNGEAKREIATRYVAAIRAGRVITDSGTAITPATLNVCIDAGWLDEQWRLTAAGRVTGHAADPAAFTPRLVGDHDEAAIPMGLPAWQLPIDADWSGIVGGQVGSGKTDTAHLLGAEVSGWPVTGNGKSRIAVDDLAPAEWGAVARGVSIAIVRRLSPAVAGDTMDRLRTQLEQIRDRAVEMMPDGVDRDAVAGDVSARGYRLAVHEARGAAKSEQVRLVLFHLQLALCRAAEGREGAAMISIRRANGVLSNA